MFKNAKVGDKVWNYAYGWGTITDMQHGYTYPIVVQFLKTTNTFTLDGKEVVSDLHPTLLWDEVAYEVPKKPLPKLEVDTKVLVWNQDSSMKCKRYFHSFSDEGIIRVWSGGITSYSAEDMNEFSEWANWELFEKNKNV